MNTVMDDNKVLTLVSNERIPLTPSMTTSTCPTWTRTARSSPSRWLHMLVGRGCDDKNKDRAARRCGTSPPWAWAAAEPHLPVQRSTSRRRRMQRHFHHQHVLRCRCNERARLFARCSRRSSRALFPFDPDVQQVRRENHAALIELHARSSTRIPDDAAVGGEVPLPVEPARPGLHRRRRACASPRPSFTPSRRPSCGCGSTRWSACSSTASPDGQPSSTACASAVLKNTSRSRTSRRSRRCSSPTTRFMRAHSDAEDAAFCQDVGGYEKLRKTSGRRDPRVLQQRVQRGDGPGALRAGPGPRDAIYAHPESAARQRHAGRRGRLRQAVPAQAREFICGTTCSASS